MPRYDQICKSCKAWREILAAPGEHPPCPECGGETERFYIRGYDFQGDEFVGGLTVENLGHEPVKVYSKSELKAECEKRGVEQMVRHVPVPGSDKSPHTQRFV
jgi:hypothetical protein